MVRVPLTVTCECGVVHQAELGQVVTCGCGRRFDTSTLDRARLGGVVRSQARMRLYVTFGILFVVAVALITWVTWSLRGVALGVPLAGLLWFRLVGPAFRRRVFHGAGDLPTWKLDADRDAPAK